MEVVDALCSVSHREIKGSFVFSCKIDKPHSERIFNRDYAFELANQRLRKTHNLSDEDILEITGTEFTVGSSVKTPTENYIICSLIGDFAIRRLK